MRSAIVGDVALQAADVTFIVRCATDQRAFENVPRDRMKVWNEARDHFLVNYRVNHTRWVLIYWPTDEEAAIEFRSNGVICLTLTEHGNVRKTGDIWDSQLCLAAPLVPPITPFDASRALRI